MVELPAGAFQMGDLSGKGDDDEKPTRTVTIPAPFAMMKHEVTFEDYDHFVKATGARRPGDEGWGRGAHPVIKVSRKDAIAYAEWLSQQTGESYRLPTEAEWEYAARAGSTTVYSWGDRVSRAHANYGKSNCCGGAVGGRDRWFNTSPVGSLKPNEWGLHDMHGNVWEWVRDCYHSSYEDAPTDGSAREHCDSRRAVIRGGSWDNHPGRLRSANRIKIPPSFRHPNTGFRLALDLAP